MKTGKVQSKVKGRLPSNFLNLKQNIKALLSIGTISNHNERQCRPTTYLFVLDGHCFVQKSQIS